MLSDLSFSGHVIEVELLRGHQHRVPVISASVDAPRPAEQSLLGLGREVVTQHAENNYGSQKPPLQGLQGQLEDLDVRTSTMPAHGHRRMSYIQFFYAIKELMGT